MRAVLFLYNPLLLEDAGDAAPDAYKPADEDARKQREGEGRERRAVDVVAKELLAKDAKRDIGAYEHEAHFVEAHHDLLRVGVPAELEYPAKRIAHAKPYAKPQRNEAQAYLPRQRIVRNRRQEPRRDEREYHELKEHAVMDVFFEFLVHISIIQNAAAALTAAALSFSSLYCAAG